MSHRKEKRMRNKIAAVLISVGAAGAMAAVPAAMASTAPAAAVASASHMHPTFVYNG